MTDDGVLHDHPLLAALRPEERGAVTSAGAVGEASPGDTLIRQGEPAPALHLLLDGTVRVVRTVDGADHELAVLGAGSWVGEGAVFGALATASVEVLTPLRSYVVPAEDAAGLREVDALTLQLDARARRRRATHRALSLPSLGLGEDDGHSVELRPVWPDDWRQLEASRDRVSQASLRQRFFSVPPLTERTLRRFADVDFGAQFAWAVLVDGSLGGIGRYALQAEDRSVAELAVLVADDLHRRGIGRTLIAALAVAAQEHGADTLLALARSDNAAVHALLADFGATWTSDGDGVDRARWPLSSAVAVAEQLPLAGAARDIARTVLSEVVDA